MIDPKDVGAAAAAVLTTSGHEGRTHKLTGGEAKLKRPVAEPLYTAPSLRLLQVSPAFVLTCHRTAGVGDPLAVALNAALAPYVIVWFVGEVRTDGAEQVLTVTVAVACAVAPRVFVTVRV